MAISPDNPEFMLDKGRNYAIDPHEMESYDPQTRIVTITRFPQAGVPEIGEVITVYDRTEEATTNKRKAKVLSVTQVGKKYKFDLEVIGD